MPIDGHTESLQILVAPRRPAGRALEWWLGGSANERGLAVLAVPPLACGQCGQMRSLFVNEMGRTVCVECAEGTSLDG